MASYRRRELAQLAHQLKLSPHRLKPGQIAGAEHLLRMIVPGKCYPYDLVCYQVTGYHKKKGSGTAGIPAVELVSDLVQLIDDLSRCAPLPAHAYGEPVHTLADLGRRLNVSTKTLSRWRTRGLVCRRVVLPDGKLHLGVLQSDARRFVHQHHKTVLRAAAFRQLDHTEKEAIIEQARQMLSERRCRLHEVAQALAARTGRAVETIRYTLRRYDSENPATALFSRGGQPAVHPDHQSIFALYEQGETVESLARQFRRPVETIADVIREMRCRRLLNRPVEYIYNPEFDAPHADELILGGPAQLPDNGDGPADPARAGLPPYLRELFGLPVLTREQEGTLFRRYNYLKYKARRRRDQLDPFACTNADIAAVDALFAQADAVKDELIRCNLRLVVSIAKRHVRNSPDFFEVVSDGNMALMRAVEKFDYALGNKFSTYASWAIMRFYARSIPESRYQQVRFQTGAEEVLERAADTALPAAGEMEQRHSLDEALGSALKLLTQRERAVVVRHFGIGRDGAGETLEQIGRVFGVTKERVRQIERGALAKLRQALPPSVRELLV